MGLLGSQKIPVGKTNVRIKSYPSKNVIQICNQSIFTLYPDAPKPKETQAGESKKTKREQQPSGNNTPPLATRIAKDPKRALEESKKRAASQVRDIALCNQFEYFITWTLDGTLIDRYDAAAVYAKVRNVLSNASRRHGFQYVLVPEYHSPKNTKRLPQSICTASVSWGLSRLNAPPQKADASGWIIMAVLCTICRPGYGAFPAVFRWTTSMKGRSATSQSTSPSRTRRYSENGFYPAETS